MKKQSLQFPLSLLALLVALFAVSCKDNSPDPASPAGINTEYDNVKYAIKNGFMHDGGPMDYFMDDEAENKTHYNYSFIMTDGTPIFEGEDVVRMDDGEIIILAVLLSPGSSGFKTGTFEYANWLGDEELGEEELETKYRNKYFFPFAYVITDKDKDKNWEEEIGAMVTGGTIKVSGTPSNYTLEYDLTLEGNKTLKGKFTGKFKVVQ
ncbi:MAG: hypothetical protein LPK09_14435 [Hymenobacteraceae bacterium]|nr:hypothetical protein [Hymenobacteraceae bacterium]